MLVYQYQLREAIKPKDYYNMKQLTINIADNKFEVFLEFIKTLDYVKVEDSGEKALEELQNSLIQVKLMKEGKLPKQSTEDFLNEL